MKEKINLFKNLYENVNFESVIRIHFYFSHIITIYVNGEKLKFMTLDYYIKNSKSFRATFK